jgi:hypothetical protein
MRVLRGVSTVAAVAVALAGAWLAAGFEVVDDLSAYRGGGNCEQREEGASCGAYTENCVRCDSGGTDLDCVDYENEWNCIACDDGAQNQECGGSAQSGIAIWLLTDPPIFAGCANWQNTGDCSRNYDSATQANCDPDVTC